MTFFGFGAPSVAADETAAQAGEKTGVEGQFVRVAENDEGWVVLGYRIANGSIKQEWMLLDVGLALQHGVEPQTIARGDIALVLPNDTVVQLATQKEYEDTAGDLRALNERANMMSDSINYFPAGANQACKIGFFANADQIGQGIAFDTVSLDDQRACVGRIYFRVPGGIEYGVHNLDVKFANSTVRVPFKIMTEAQAKEFEKQWKEAEKEAKEEKH